MSVEFDHTIVPTRDREKSARSLARIPVWRPGAGGVFPPVTTANESPRTSRPSTSHPAQHYAFSSRGRFDAILTRLVDAGSPAGPIRTAGTPPYQPRRRRSRRGTSGPGGHGLEAITLPYGTDPARR
ncbi:VOC family protein [Streptomyces heliomycini]